MSQSSNQRSLNKTDLPSLKRELPNSKTDLPSSRDNSLNTPEQTTPTKPPLPPPVMDSNLLNPYPLSQIPPPADTGTLEKSALEQIAPQSELTPNQKKLALQLAGIYATAGMFVSGFNTYDGLLLVSQAETRANEVVMAARHNKTAMKWVERLCSGNDLVAAIIGHGLMAYALLANHGRVASNPVILQGAGMTKEQVLGIIPGLHEAQNGASATK